MKLRMILNRLRAVTPHRSTHGQLYNKRAETKKRHSTITLYTLFESVENTHIILPHVFRSNTPRTALEWSNYMSEKVSGKDGSAKGPAPRIGRLRWIHRNSILPGMHMRTGKQWSVKRLIGWVGGTRRK